MSAFPDKAVAKSLLEKAARLATQGSYGDQALDPHQAGGAPHIGFDIALPRRGARVVVCVFFFQRN